MNIYDTANKLAAELKQTDEYKLIEKGYTLEQATILQGKLSIPVSDDNKAQAQQNRVMNIVLSVMLGVFTISVSSAVGIYYVFSNIISIIISFTINKVLLKDEEVTKK